MVKKALAAAALAALVLGLADGAVAYGLAHPGSLSHLPRLYGVLVRGVYLDGARNVVQFEPDFARYDPDLTYTLKPGAFVFPNKEFSAEYRVNSLGTRSDEEELRAPHTIVIGDSQAMGWGVAQRSMYSELLGASTRQRTLNAAVSSYGTVREMRLLDRLDPSALKCVVIHYMENDYEENAHYFRHANTIRIMPQADYERVRSRYLKSKRYFFGKYTLLLLYRYAGEAKEGILRLIGKEPPRLDALYFLNAFMHARSTPLEGVKLIVLADSGFIGRLQSQIISGDYPAYVKGLVLVSDTVPENGYYRLDNHLNSDGHRLLAERLLSVVK